MCKEGFAGLETLRRKKQRLPAVEVLDLLFGPAIVAVEATIFAGIFRLGFVVKSSITVS